MKRPGLLHLADVSPAKLLKVSNWADELVTSQVERLAAFFTPYHAPARTTIISEGEPGDFFCLICDGIVEVVKEYSEGKSKVINSLGHGKSFGEMAFFDGGAASASIIVKEQATLLIMEMKNFDALCEDSSYLALMMTLKLSRIISLRLREASGKLVDLMANQNEAQAKK